MNDMKLYQILFICATVFLILFGFVFAYTITTWEAESHEERVVDDNNEPMFNADGEPAYNVNYEPTAETKTTRNICYVLFMLCAFFGFLALLSFLAQI